MRIYYAYILFQYKQTETHKTPGESFVTASEERTEGCTFRVQSSS